MASTKSLTGNQRAARYANAEKLRCPRCERGNALSTRYPLYEYGDRVGSLRECRYCGHEVGIYRDQSFGRRDVTPEPGTREKAPPNPIFQVDEKGQSLDS